MELIINNPTGKLLQEYKRLFWTRTNNKKVQTQSQSHKEKLENQRSDDWAPLLKADPP